MVFNQQARPVPEIANDIIAAVETEKDSATRYDKLDELAREAVHLTSRHAAELYAQLVMAGKGKRKD